MYIARDIAPRIAANSMVAQLLIGPRQCGKSTLLANIGKNAFQEVTFDDLRLRQLANQDPALFFEQYQPPVLLDEIQYAPNIFPEIKRQIDQLKRKRLEEGTELSTLYRMTGSNQILLDKNIKESLAGRASYFFLNTLTVHEIQNTLPDITVREILFKGGWPELYIDPSLPTVTYLNDYIRSYIEKDIVLSAGIQKQEAFNSILGLLAARTGMLLDYTNISRDSGIQAVTIKEWVSILERAGLIYRLKPYASNLNKRLTKTPKFYFLDTGLAARLQGWQDLLPLITSPQAGALFETLVLAEIYKFIQNYEKSWELYLWRTKEGEEIDFLIITESGKVIACDAKMGIQSVQPQKIPEKLKKMFPQLNEMLLVTIGGEKLSLSKECRAVPISQLHAYFSNI